MAFYEEYAAHRDLFEIIAIHDQRVKSFAELDQRLASIRKRHWQGKDLPFPVLIDGEGKTHRLYGIQGWPTTVLIDPEGVLVGRVRLAELRAKLPPLSPSQTWARQRDLGNNLFWDVEPGRFTLTLLATVLERWSHCQIEIDTEAVEASGLKADAPLPGVVYGNPITLRSIEELLLAAPAAQVSGRIEPNNLRQSLLRMLAPLDLVLEVRHEVVLVTPANERP
jgi:hypothetical protein